ncbi:hypothetical protein VTP01DRAFT_6245 [Rhizomucor pusillus]|uniref:uncharacterized protein n=1 Tax=Rhizomucor pusillus TaxID=4840 RepID=UPI003742F632
MAMLFTTTKFSSVRHLYVPCRWGETFRNSHNLTAAKSRLSAIRYDRIILLSSRLFLLETVVERRTKNAKFRGKEAYVGT